MQRTTLASLSLAVILLASLACTLGVDDPDAGATDGAGSDAATVDTGVHSTQHSCTFACATAADCARASNQPEGDFACETGVCRYLGCQSDSECTAAQGAGYVCRQFPGSVPGCTRACTSSSDCASFYSGQFEADELSCDNGGCRYTGCVFDSECTHMGSGLVCRGYGAALPTCVAACATNDDCASAYRGVFDADELRCENNGCHFLGCQSDTECPASGAGLSPLCR